MFESFCARGLHIQSAVNLAMYSHWIAEFEQHQAQQAAGGD